MTSPVRGRNGFLPVDERKDPMSEFSVYSVGKSNSEGPMGPATNHENHRVPVEPAGNIKSPISTSSFPGNTRLIFKVDDTSHDVVVMIVDEASSEVIRTVPGDAMKDIPSGGLIQKNA
jgi:uncharacterized FlaG/YvyC family protein